MAVKLEVGVLVLKVATFPDLLMREPEWLSKLVVVDAWTVLIMDIAKQKGNDL